MLIELTSMGLHPERILLHSGRPSQGESLSWCAKMDTSIETSVQQWEAEKSNYKAGT